MSLLRPLRSGAGSGTLPDDVNPGDREQGHRRRQERKGQVAVVPLRPELLLVASKPGAAGHAQAGPLHAARGEALEGVPQQQLDAAGCGVRPATDQIEDLSPAVENVATSTAAPLSRPPPALSA